MLSGAFVMVKKFEGLVGKSMWIEFDFGGFGTLFVLPRVKGQGKVHLRAEHADKTTDLLSSFIRSNLHNLAGFMIVSRSWHFLHYNVRRCRVMWIAKLSIT